MMARNKQTRTLEVVQRAEQAWDPNENPALAQLLNHIAEDLARGYVRLMEAAADKDATSGSEE